MYFYIPAMNKLKSGLLYLKLEGFCLLKAKLNSFNI